MQESENVCLRDLPGNANIYKYKDDVQHLINCTEEFRFSL